MKKILFIVTVYSIIAAVNGLICYINDGSGNDSTVAGCNFCGYYEIPNDSCADPIGISRLCLEKAELLYSNDENNTHVYSMLNQCSIRASNCWIYKLSICTIDYCNYNCEGTTDIYTDDPTVTSEPFTWWYSSTSLQTSTSWNQNSGSRNTAVTVFLGFILFLFCLV